MRAWIGIAETQKTVELEVDDADELRKLVEDAKDGSIVWLTDVKDRSVGIPAGKIAYVEIEAEGKEHTVGFSPGSG